MIRISPTRCITFGALLAAVFLLCAAPLVAGQNEVRKINRQGNQLYTEDQWADALDRYTAAGEIDPENPVLHYNLGNALFRLNDLDKAETHYRVAAAAEDPELARRARFNLGNTEFRRAETLEGAGDWQGRNQSLTRSIDHWRSVLDAEPDNRDAKLNLELARRKLLEEPPENSSSNSRTNRTSRKKSRTRSRSRTSRSNSSRISRTRKGRAERSSRRSRRKRISSRKNKRIRTSSRKISNSRIRNSSRNSNKRSSRIRSSRIRSNN